VLVFIEVKTNKSVGEIPPEIRVNKIKQRQLGKIAGAYIHKTRAYDIDCRFDIISVLLDCEGEEGIEHFQDAFWLPGNI